MPFPIGWPPRPSSGLRSIRWFVSGLAGAAYADTAYLFNSLAGANTMSPTPVVKPGDVAPVTLGTPATWSGSPMGGGVGEVNPTNNEAPPVPMLWAANIAVYNDEAGAGQDLYVSFDGVNDHAILLPGETHVWRQRYEAGISVKGGGLFRIEAW